MDIPDKVVRISENADFIRKNTPVQPPDAEWDDPEEWVVEAAQLAHDIIDLIKHFQNGGEIPRAWLPPDNKTN